MNVRESTVVTDCSDAVSAFRRTDSVPSASASEQAKGGNRAGSSLTRDSRAGDDREVREVEQGRVVLPRGDLQKCVGAHDEEQLRWREPARVEVPQRVRRIRNGRLSQFEIQRAPARRPAMAIATIANR